MEMVDVYKRQAQNWNWSGGSWSWNYPTLAMNATRLLQPEIALRLLLSDFTRNGTGLDGKDIKGRLLDSITTPLGKIIIHATPNYVKGETYTLYVGCLLYTSRCV